MTEHFATIEVTEGADGTFLAEIYLTVSETPVEGYGQTPEDAVKEAMRSWMGEQT